MEIGGKDIGVQKFGCIGGEKIQKFKHHEERGPEGGGRRKKGGTKKVDELK